MKQQFIVNQDRDRIYPLCKEFLHISVLISDVGTFYQLKIAGLHLGDFDTYAQAARVMRMVKNYKGNNGAVLAIPGYSNYDSHEDWLELLDKYKRLERVYDELD